MKLGIAAKLTLLLALVGILASGVTGFYAYRASRDLLVDSAKTELLTSTQVLARRITLTRDEISRNLQVLASHPAALAALRGDEAAPADQLATLFNGVMAAHPAYLQLRLIAAADFGMERVRVDRLDRALVRVSGDDLQEKGHFAYVAETLRLTSGATYLSRITVNHESGVTGSLNQPALQQAMPVMDARGIALGVVVVNVDLNSMFALLATDLPPSFRLFMANGAGDILIHPDGSKTFGFDKGRRVLVQVEFPDTAALVDGGVDNLVFDLAAQGAGGEALVAAFISQSIQSPANHGRLILGLAQPLEQVLVQSRQLGNTVLQIVFGLGLACMLLAALLASALTRPINAVTEAARRFAAGEPAGSLPVQRLDEIGSLARSFQRMQQQITQQLADLTSSQNELEHLSQHDMLTGLPNRRLFQERLQRALAYARRYEASVGLLFLDLNDFKDVNDACGHIVGDAVLRAVAERLRSMTREVDTVARIGGDEFVVLVGTPAPQEHLSAIAEKLLIGLREPIELEGHRLQIGASIGISRYPEDGQGASELMAGADRAMYAAKQAGSDGYRFASQS